MEQNIPQDIVANAKIYAYTSIGGNDSFSQDRYDAYVAGALHQLAKQQLPVSETVEAAARKDTDAMMGGPAYRLAHPTDAYLQHRDNSFIHGATWANQQPCQGYSEREQYMRKQAITVIELTKGFATNPTDNAMKSLLEMTNYVLELTNKPSAPIQVGGWQDNALEDAWKDGHYSSGNNPQRLPTTHGKWLSEYKKTHSPIPDKRIEEMREWLFKENNAGRSGIIVKFNTLFPPTKTTES